MHLSLLLRCLLPLLLLLSAAAQAIDAGRGLHQLQHTSWTVRDGAPDDIIVMTQGNDGYLWLGTHAGVSRFDGLRFAPLVARQGSFPDTVALALQRASDGGMWIGWQVGGISHVKDGVVRNFGEAQGLPPGAIWGFAIDGKGHVWAAGVAGVARFDGQRWQAMDTRHGYTAQKASAVFADRDGRVGVFSEQGLFVWQPQQARFAPPVGKLDLRAPPQRGRDGRLFLLELRGIRLIDSLERYDQLDHPWIYRDTSGTSGSMLVDSAGSLWFDSQHGLHRTRSSGNLAPQQRGVSSDTESFLPKDGLSNVLISSLCEDNEGNVWVATAGGLDRFREAGPVVLSGNLDPATPDPFRAQQLWPGANGAMWLSRRDDPFPLMLVDAHGAVLQSPQIGAITALAGAGASLWVGSAGALHELAASDGRRLRRIAYPADAAVLNTMRAIAVAGDGSIWAIFSGAGVFHYRNGAWRREPRLPGGGLRVPLTLLADREGRIWFSYPDGSLAMLASGRLHTYGPAQGLDIGQIGDLSQYQGQIWAGGQQGVAVWRNDRFVRLQTVPAAATQGVAGLLRARDGSLWLNAANGATHIAAGEVAHALHDPGHAMRARSYDAIDGLNGSISMLQSHSVAEAADGRIWFSRQSATFWFDPRNTPPPLPPPQVEILALQVDGVTVAPPDLQRLPAGTRDLQFTYNASSLGTPARLRFRYMLEGYDSNWQKAGSQRQVQYTGLGPGRYRFMVMAINGDGVSSEQAAQLSLRVLPAMYQTWWFHSLCGVLLLACLYGLLRWRLHRHEAQLQSRLEVQQAERERIARELHDTLLQGAQAMIVHFHLASLALSPDDPARGALQRALDNAESLLGEGRDQVHHLRTGDEAGMHWCDVLQREGERLAVQHGVRFRYSEEGTPAALRQDDAHEIYRIVSEAMRNAFRHARAQLIEVLVQYSCDGVEITVRDDGQGMPPAVMAHGQLPGHWGLPGMRERAARLGAQLTHSARPGAGGTQWHLWMPARNTPANWLCRCLPYWLRRRLVRRRACRSGVENAAP